jgi:hypothetical protein
VRAGVERRWVLVVTSTFYPEDRRLQHLPVGGGRAELFRSTRSANIGYLAVPDAPWFDR